MATMTLFEQGAHRNLLLEDFGGGLAVQANQHLIIHGDRAVLLDPGGHKTYARSRGEVTSQLKGARLTDLFLSHQDPDIVAALNGWLMTSDARAHVPALWIRFVAHFGIDALVESRIEPVPDGGRVLPLGDVDLLILPAHFLHSCGNFQVYDPCSKILYTGDLGASLGMDYWFVEDFDAHLKYMEGFHRRYMTSSVAMQGWAAMAQGMDIEMIAPQHGAIFKGRDMVKRFIDWVGELKVGLDVMTDIYRMPAKG